jgi:hypothetical protein
VADKVAAVATLIVYNLFDYQPIMVKSIFKLVAFSLIKIARKLGITYNEINIIVYYLLIPLSWTVMADFCIKLPLTTTALLCVWLGILIGSWGCFSDWCDWLFAKSVDFLNYFNRWGGNYVLNSVLICVLVPILIYGALIFWLIQTY